MKHLALLVGMAGITIAICLVAAFVEENIILYSMVIPSEDMPLEDWLYNFRYWAIIGIVVAGAVSIFWYVMTQWLFNFNDWKQANVRTVWALLFLIPLAMFILAFLFTPPPQEGGWLAYLFYFLNGVLCYYFATALCSPDCVKYSPLLASQVWRRWW